MIVDRTSVHFRLAEDVLVHAPSDALLAWGVSCLPYFHPLALEVEQEATLLGVAEAVERAVLEGLDPVGVPTDLASVLDRVGSDAVRALATTFAERIPRLLVESGFLDSEAEIPIKDGNTPTEMMLAGVVRVCAFVAQHYDVHAVDIKDYPAGLLWVPIGSRAAALVDPLTLRVIDVSGRLIGFSVGGPPGDATATPSSKAIAELAAVWFAENYGPPNKADNAFLLALQKTSALEDPALDGVITGKDLLLGRAGLQRAIEDMGRGDLVQLGLRLEDCENDPHWKAKVATIVQSAGRAMCSQVLIHARTLADGARAELQAGAEALVNGPRHHMPTSGVAAAADIRVERLLVDARAATRSSVVAWRCGVKTEAYSKLWDQLAPEVVAHVHAELSKPPIVWTFPAIPGGPGAPVGAEARCVDPT